MGPYRWVISEEDRYWLAGIMESDGFLGNNGGLHVAQNLVMRVAMTDLDVVERVHELWDRLPGNRHVYVGRPAGERTKTLWSTAISGDAALSVLGIIYPLLGSRRRLQAQRAICIARPGALSVVTVSPSSPTGSGGLSLHWLAGFLEGDGSFHMPFPSAPHKPRISVRKPHEDTLSLVSALWGTKRQTVRRPGRRETYVAQIGGNPAVLWMRKLHSLMGARRRRQIDAALGCYHPKWSKHRQSEAAAMAAWDPVVA